MNLDRNSTCLNKIQHNLREFCMGGGVPCISVATEQYLLSLLQELQAKQCLEIGSACGYSLLTTANIIQAREGHIVGVERAYPNRVILEQVRSLARQYGLDNIECLYGPFLQCPPTSLQSTLGKDLTSPQAFDFIFIDAQKSEYPLYIDYIISNNLIHDKTVIVFDDVIKYQDRMTDLQKTLSHYEFQYEIKQLENDDGVLIAHK